MKRSDQRGEIKTDDLNSLLFWKVFWKMMRRETPLVFWLKVSLIAVFFLILVVFISLIGDFSAV